MLKVLNCEWSVRGNYSNCHTKTWQLTASRIAICIGNQPRRSDKILGGRAEQLEKLIQRQPIVTDAARSQGEEREKWN